MKSHGAILPQTGAQCRAEFCEIGKFSNKAYFFIGTYKKRPHTPAERYAAHGQPNRQSKAGPARKSITRTGRKGKI